MKKASKKKPTEDKPHLWEVEHPFYCAEQNYFTNTECGQHFQDIESFLEEESDSDLDMNLVFRWDWLPNIPDNWDDGPFPKDGIFKVFIIGQRKGIYRWVTVDVSYEDENKVIKYLQPRLEHIKTLWAPLI